MTRVLALDVGTSSVRARIYDAEGSVERDEVAQTRYSVTHGRGGRAELDPHHLVEATRAAIGCVLDEPGERVDAVGISCFWHSLVVLDRAGEPLSPVFIWQDTRSVAQAERLARTLDADAVHARTGAPLHPGFWPAKLLWLREERPELFASAARFACFSELLLARLTGQPRLGLSMASGTGLLRLAGGWDEELLEAVGVEPERLASVSDEPAGGREPWLPALGDGACANLGAGCESPGRASLTVGTSGALRLVHRDATAPLPHALFRYRLDAERVVEGGALSDGGNLYAWLDQTLRLPEERSVAEREPDGHGLIFLPLLGGERSPGWNGRARGAVAGLTFDTRPLDILQAALEGVAYRFADVADALPGLGTVVANGGALQRDPSLAQLLADVLERPVELSPVAEASARGAAVAALRRIGARPLDPPPGRLFEPRSERAHAYRSARKRRRELERRWT